MARQLACRTAAMPLRTLASRRLRPAALRMDTQRLILLFIFGFSLLMLWEAWDKEHRPKPLPAVPTAPQAVPAAAKPVPSAEAKATAGSVPAAAESAAGGETVRVSTDLLVAEIDTLGGTLKRLELLRHKDSSDPSRNFVLFGPHHGYEAQSGLTGENGPNHRSPWRALPAERSLAPGQDALLLRLTATGRDGAEVEKVYTFRRNSYEIGISLNIRNPRAAAVPAYAYFQLAHDGKPELSGGSLAQSFGAQSFTGFAIYTSEGKFEKIAPADLDKGKGEHSKHANNGWLAFVQHYFVSAWLPPDGAERDYVVEKRADGIYAGRVLIGTKLVPGTSASVSVRLYAGPLFWLLEKFHALSGNWGVAIILLTLFIKLVFFPLSAASYKSMARMKLITPRLTKLREMYGHDRQKMNQAMMELYKTEKINPLGGCFPILVQIPVFIALYWVLLAAIELRHAPFILWLHDLSALDPYYVLPILMTGTMVLQTRMNPTPPDPVQAKVMQFMPFVFSIFFFFFPAGLVLYWLVNNILSILQQWQIQRLFDRDKPAHAKR